MKALLLATALLAAACSEPRIDPGYTLIVNNGTDAPIRVHPEDGDPTIDYLIRPGEIARIDDLQVPVTLDPDGSPVIGVGVVSIWSGGCEPITRAEVSTGPWLIHLAGDGGLGVEPFNGELERHDPAQLLRPPCR